jgi:hypothetical protein
LFCVDGLDGRSQTARRFRDQLETHSETSLETVHGLRSGVLDTRTNE